MFVSKINYYMITEGDVYKRVMWKIKASKMHSMKFILFLPHNKWTMQLIKGSQLAEFL